METVVLSIHLILALLLIGVVLLQKNEGAALLSGGGNMQARGQATALTKLTWILAAAFIATSIALTVLGTRGGGGSVLDAAPVADAPADAPAAPAGADLLPPVPADAPAAPPAPEAAAPADAPAADAPATAPADTAPAEGAAPAPATGGAAPAADPAKTTTP